MISVQSFHEFLRGQDICFFAGVPDSQLREFCDYLASQYGTGKDHVIAANEGNAVAIAAGYHLATGKVPLVYLQNSGLGNAVNPITSLLDPKVYAIPVVFLIGWRGRPGVHDEPQHAKQGEITLTLLETLGIEHCVVEAEGKLEDLKETFQARLKPKLDQGCSVALVVAKGAFEKYRKEPAARSLPMSREQAVQAIAGSLGERDFVVSTTGKLSRELYELRQNTNQSGGHDFLTVGSMGHAASIALGIAERKSDRRIWCLDGDGALIMHMGCMALIGSRAPSNLVHVLLNNCAHESVGGMPTVAASIDFPAIARACGYPVSNTVSSIGELESSLAEIRARSGLVFLQVNVNLDCRADLGRPKSTPVENKKEFTRLLRLPKEKAC